MRADITSLKRTEEKNQSLSRYDSLTGLPNGSFIKVRVNDIQGEAVRNGQYYAVLCVGLDNFRNTNDCIGHAQGSKLIVRAAERLMNIVGESGVVGRVGEDEFVVALGGVGVSEAEARSRSQELCDWVVGAMAAPYFLNDGRESGDLICSGSVGVDIQRNEVAVDEVLARASLALNAAKSSGRSSCVFFKDELRTRVASKIMLENELRQAIQADEMKLVYQKIVDDKGNAVGAEGLLRWCRENGEVMLPSRFIPLAEETGLIITLGQEVLKQGCRSLLAWSRDPERSVWTLSVNVSARQFSDSNFVNDTIGIIKESGVDATKLILEITESALLAGRASQAAERMKVLKGCGVQFALDDFGTGYSSLSYLQQLPLDRLKVDQSFVRNIASSKKDQGIVKSIISLATGLDMEMVAEGVETPGQFELLRSYGCRLFQGFLFSRPE